MNSEQIVRISQHILHTRSDPSMCATFHLAEEAGKWIQYGDERINAAYPLTQHPASLVATLGGQLDCWEARKFVTVLVGDIEAAALARWIDTYFRWVLESHDAALTIKLAHFTRCLDRA